MALVAYHSCLLHPHTGSKVNLEELFAHAEGFCQADRPLLWAFENQPRPSRLQLVQGIVQSEVTRLIHVKALFANIANDIEVGAIGQRLALLRANLPCKKVKCHLMVNQVVHRLRLIITKAFILSITFRAVGVIFI